MLMGIPLTLNWEKKQLKGIKVNWYKIQDIMNLCERVN